MGKRQAFTRKRMSIHLKNSVEKHRPREKYSAIRERIAQTKERIEKTAWQLEQLSSPKAASYLRRGLDSMMPFADTVVRDSFQNQDVILGVPRPETSRLSHHGGT